MARIKIKDLTKGIKVTEEELKQVRGGLVIKEFKCTHGFYRVWPPPPSPYPMFEMCQMVQAMGCGCPG